MGRIAAGKALRAAEDHLRERGLTGARAFDVLMDALTQPSKHRSLLVACPDLELIVSEGEAVSLVDLAYERFFSDLFKAKRGQYFTPPPLVQILVSLAQLKPGERVLDPTAGSGALVVAAAHAGCDARGIELDPSLARLANLQLQLAQVPGDVQQGNCFTRAIEPVDVMLANPPFSLALRDRALLSSSTLAQGRDSLASDWLFMERAAAWVRPGGRAVVILPFSVVANPSAGALREHIDQHWSRKAMVVLPEGVFRPFGGAAGRAVIVVLERGGTPSPVQWAALTDPGYDPSSRRIKPTSMVEVDGLCAGRGWMALPSDAWHPTPPSPVGERSLSEIARAESSRFAGDSQEVWSAELADSDRDTGELTPKTVRVEALGGPRQDLHAGQVVLSRLRPELNRVAVVPPVQGPLVGSLEWIALRVRFAPHYVLHALRTPSWRRGIPVTRGQTRPRFHAADVLARTIPWPGDELAEQVDRMSRRIHSERAELRVRLELLQAAVDAFASGEISAEELEARLREIEPVG